ncbi:YIP1 family protein [Methanosarcina sp.]|uniref:YIP1 family protein n=1 Tax=Methanosarcina sp. TaxID=2213 RepID=UPI003C765604
MILDYIDTWKDIMQKPSDFYREMPETGGYFDPVIFSTVSAAIGTFIHLIFTPETDEVRKFISTVPIIAVMIPFIGIIALFVDATILYAVYKTLGGKGTYEGTAKFVLYSSAASSLIWIPFVGWIFGIYQVYLYIVGGKFVHEISMERSLAAVALSILLLLLFGVLIALSGLAPGQLTAL